MRGLGEYMERIPGWFWAAFVMLMIVAFDQHQKKKTAVTVAALYRGCITLHIPAGRCDWHIRHILANGVHE